MWFGVLALMILEVSLATPPFGLLLFVAKGAAPAGTTMRDVIGSVTPFIVMVLAVVALLIVVPQFALFLPGLMLRWVHSSESPPQLGSPAQAHAGRDPRRPRFPAIALGMAFRVASFTLVPASTPFGES